MQNQLAGSKSPAEKEMIMKVHGGIGEVVQAHFGNLLTNAKTIEEANEIAEAASKKHEECASRGIAPTLTTDLYDAAEQHFAELRKAAGVPEAPKPPTQVVG